MELFQIVRKCFVTVGALPLQSNQKCPLNFRNISFLLIVTSMFISTMTYFLFTKLSIHHMDTLFVSVTSFACLVNFSYGLSKMTHLMRLIERFEELIQKSNENWNGSSLSQ